ncbi:hypothetical protein RN001_003056 [Aquatica leii]|uniref:DUF4806 domain-containing protein n=1 Tax=Aquatica leii TaxID=1421715 RepID=A0AAN7SSY5_9COLE|nr:hypothetical protein RN001_003056 [Aquatica leii]
MYNTFSNELGMRFSWDGTKGTQKFKNLRLVYVIIDAVCLNKGSENAANDKIIKIIKAWLVRAKDRFNTALKSKNQEREQTPIRNYSISK